MRRSADKPLVYAIVCPRQATIKIGFSTSPMERVGGLMTGSPDWLFLWSVWKGGREGEKHAHRALDAHRLQGEWFTAHPDVINYVVSRTHPDWEADLRSDFRYAGEIMNWACFWAAFEDEEQDEGNENYGIHRRKPCTIVGIDDGAPLPSISRPREGHRHVLGPLVPELRFNDMGSEYWQLSTPIEPLPSRSPRSNRARNRVDIAQIPQQPLLFPTRRDR